MKSSRKVAKKPQRSQSFNSLRPLHFLTFATLREIFLFLAENTSSIIYFIAITEISTFTNLGKFATSTVSLAGAVFSLKYEP